MDRFFVEADQIKDKSIFIVGDDVKHISGPLRLGIGDKIEVVSEGYLYIGIIENLTKKEVELRIIGCYKDKKEPIAKIHLYQGLAKGSKMDYIIQKGTEVGIDKITIVEMDRSVSRISSDKKKVSKLERWRKIAEEAAKQSKRGKIPEVVDAISSDDMILELKNKKNILVAYEEEEKISIKNVISKITEEEINIIIGPEGGISKEEINQLKNVGAKTMSLGPRILRTETAGLVMASILLYELGDI